jgi:hypothetical protein
VRQNQHSGDAPQSADRRAKCALCGHVRPSFGEKPANELLRPTSLYHTNKAAEDVEPMVIGWCRACGHSWRVAQRVALPRFRANGAPVCAEIAKRLAPMFPDGTDVA